VGGLDPLSHDEVTEPVEEGYPVILADWIKRDGLNCLKIKLRGTDAEWDLERLIRVGEIAIEHDVEALTSDFNCTVMEPEYVVEILNKLSSDYPEIYRRLLYVEQPFPYDLHKHEIDVRVLSAEKPLLMDESAHDWEHVRYGHSLGWNGVALKTCKTQTGALLISCWAQAHKMHLMVQDLTNPMLAQISHVMLAAHTPTMMGVETNSMQFYPDASSAEAEVHPGIYQRRNGCVDLASIQGAGFGYRVSEIQRVLPGSAFDSING
jgi:L-alanine-DL-glutamate epimerase-like enolase superfamily enzyme